MLNLTRFTLKEGDRRGREEKQKGNGNSGKDDRGEKWRKGFILRGEKATGNANLTFFLIFGLPNPHTIRWSGPHLAWRWTHGIRAYSSSPNVAPIVVY